jgi:hypothetical protein
MKRILALFAVFLVLPAVMGLSQAAVAGEDPHKGYSRYELEVHADPANRLLTGRQRVRFVNTFPRPLDEVYFLMYNPGKEPNPFLPEILNDVGYADSFEPGYTEIKRVTDENGQELAFSFLPHTEFVKVQKYSMDEAVFHVQLATPLAPGEEIVLRIDFEVIIPEVVTAPSLSEKWYYQDIFILRHVWYPVEVDRTAEDWVFDKLIFTPHFLDRFTLTLPKEYTVAVGGEKCAERVEGDLKTVTVTNENPVIPTTMVFSTRFQKVSTITGDGTEINLYHLPEARPEQVAYLLDAAVEIVETYNRRYGMNYPRINIINTPYTTLSAMAGNGTVLMTDSFFSTALVFYRRIHYYTLAHELAHLWCGVGTSYDFDKENFLSEGLADLIAYNLTEERFPDPGNLYEPIPFGSLSLVLFYEYLPAPSWTFRDISHGDYISYRRDGWDQPLYTGFEDSYLHVSSVRDYDKGYMVFKMLETYVGREVMAEALKEFFTLYRRRVATVKDLRAIIEEKSGKSLARFFADWIYGTEYVDYYIKEVKSTKAEQAGTGEEYLTELAIGKKGQGLTALEVEFVLESGEKLREFIPEVNGDTTLTVVTGEKVRGVVLDPDYNVLETDRANNKNIDRVDFYVFGDARKLLERRPWENYFLSFGPSLHLGTEEAGLGLTLAGEKAFKHNWRLGAASLFNTAGNTNAASTRFFGEFNFLTARGGSLSLATTYDKNKLNNRLQFSYPIYKAVETGFYGHYYYPVYTFTAGLSQEEFSALHSDRKPLLAITAGLAYDRFPDKGLSSDLTLEGAIKAPGYDSYQYFKADNTTMKIFKVTSGLYGAATLKAGAGDELPSFKKYKAALMRGYTGKEEGDLFASLAVDLMFPITFGKKVEVIRGVVFRGLAGSVFLEAGDVWENRSGGQNFFGDLKVNAGVEISPVLTISALTDLTVPITMGYAHNLNGHGGEFYLRLDTPLTIFASVFSY